MSTLKTNNIQHVDRSDPSIIINTDGSVNIAGTMTYEDVTSVDAVGIITGRDNLDAQKQVHVGTGVSVKAGGLNVTAGITTVQALQATTGTFSGDVDIADKIVHTGDTDTAIRFSGADTIQLETGGSVRTHIHSNGRFRVGCTAQPSATVGGFQLDMGSYPGSLRLSQGGGTSGTDGAGITVYGGQNGTGIGAAAATGAVLNLVNTNNTDNNQTSVDFSNSNSLSIAKVIGKNDSHSSRNGSLIFATSSAAAPTEKLRITSDGKFGFNKTDPSNDLVLKTTAAHTSMVIMSASESTKLSLQTVQDSDVRVGTISNHPLTIYSNSLERMRIDTSGGLLVGTTSNVAVGGATGALLQVETTSQNGISCISHRGTGNASGSILILAKSRGTSSGSVTAVASGDELGALRFAGADGTDLQSRGAEVSCEVDGAPGGNDMPGRLLFKTTADGNSSTTTRLTINQAGNAQFTGIVTATEFVATSVQTGGRKNLIINGGMSIAQRGTAAVTVTSSAAYRSVDRWKTDLDGSGGGDFSHAQSTDVPTGQGFRHSSKCTTVTQASQPSGTSNRNQFYTMLEKQDIYHLEWGTSNAKTCTLSFWVKGSVTGTYILWMKFYGSSDYHYYTNYTIDSANTWEKKTITLTGHTSGGNVALTADQGLLIEWNLGTSSGNETGTLNEWTTSSTIRAAAGSVYLPENSGATWYITGVQFEVGSNGSAFEFRSYGDELALCQRYYENVKGASYNDSGNEVLVSNGFNYTSSRCLGNFQFKVEKRARPSTSTDDVSEVQVLKTNGSWYSSGGFGGNSNIYCTRLDCTSISGSPMNQGEGAEIRLINDGIIHFDAEL